VHDGEREYVVRDDGVAVFCSCGAKKGPCPHVQAVERFQKSA
jgi:hypothetical protein